MLNSFLQQQAQYLVQNYSDNFENVTIVLPNKRAKLFLLNELKELTQKTFFAPKIISIEILIEEISGLKNIDNIELLFEFYQTYKLIEKSDVVSFEEFSGWASTFIQDVNEIDRYLIEADKLFQYLIDIDHINKWDVNLENTILAQNTVNFWKRLPNYYKAFRDQLKTKKIGYQGLLYRQSVEKLNAFVSHNKQKYLFFGFNALNNAEQQIIKTLLENNQAEVTFDIDQIFLNDPYHDAGLFLRKIKSSWKYFNTNPFNNITNDFNNPKNIEIISTAKGVGQAKIAGKIIEQLINDEHANLNKTAIILADENLLLPVLNSLPNNVSSLNISMGYNAKNNPIQILIQKIFKFHLNTINRRKSVYYKEVLNILSNPFFEKIIDAQSLIQFIKVNNITFFSLEYFEKIFLEKLNECDDLFQKIFQINISSDEFLDNLIELILIIKNKIEAQTEEQKINLTFIYSIYNILIKIRNYQEQYKEINSLETLYSIYKQVVNQAEISFEGEPLTGLQIMGILETRNLDFENIIITSLNEGILPGGKSGNSFIPYDVKKEYDLPTYKERDAIFSYHFYRLLQRAKNIFLIYNNSTEGLDSGEKSRFINQIEYEYHTIHHIKTYNYNSSIESNSIKKTSIKKDQKLLHRLEEIATVKGFSPSSLTTYLRNPLKFYLQRILKIYEAEEVEEEIAANTFGNIIHNVLERMYQPYIGKTITHVDINSMLQFIDSYTKEAFVNEYKLGSFDRGKNLISFEIAKRNIYNFLSKEIEFLIQNEVKIISLETAYECLLTQDEFPELPYNIKISGKIDRIDQYNNMIRVIDYKTGKVEPQNLKLNDFQNFAFDLKNEKIIQLLCYGLMIQNENFLKEQSLQLGIISFKNLSAGFMKTQYVKDDLILDNEKIYTIKKELIQLILEILNIDIPFEEKL